MSICSECLDRGYDMCFCPPSPAIKTVESKIEILERINLERFKEIESLKVQLKREQATVDLISLTSNKPKCGMISMALLKEVASETVKARD